MESGQEPELSRGAERRRGPVAHVKATWLFFTPEQKREALLAFQEAYDDHSEMAFGSELQADAALFWIVLRLRGRRSWRSCEAILDGMRERLTPVLGGQQPFKAAIERLGADAAEVEPKQVLKEIRGADRKAYDALMVRQNAGFLELHGWVKAKGLKLGPYVVVILVLLGFGRAKKAAASAAVVLGIALLAWCSLDPARQDAGAPAREGRREPEAAEYASSPLDKDAAARPLEASGSGCDRLDHEYRRRECFLARGEALTRTDADEALAAFQAGLQVPRWQDDSIPELAAEKWKDTRGRVFELQQVQMERGASSIYYRRRQFKEARDAYRRSFDIRRALPQESLPLLMSADECFIMMAMERKHVGAHAAARAREECVTNYPGDSRLPFDYESGLAYLAKDQHQQAAIGFMRQIFWSNYDFPTQREETVSKAWPGLVEGGASVRAESVRQLDAAIARLAQKGLGLRLGNAWALVTESELFIMPFPTSVSASGPCSRLADSQWEFYVGSERETRRSAWLPIVIPLRGILKPERIEAVQLDPLACWPPIVAHTFCFGDKLKVDGDCLPQ